MTLHGLERRADARVRMRAEQRLAIDAVGDELRRRQLRLAAPAPCSP